MISAPRLVEKCAHAMRRCTQLLIYECAIFTLLPSNSTLGYGVEIKNKIYSAAIDWRSDRKFLNPKSIIDRRDILAKSLGYGYNFGICTD
jgi:hypothetical protein